MEKMPVLISIPHGGNQVLLEVADIINLSDADIFHDGDSLTRQLYGFQNQVEAFVEASVARAVVDLNRHPDDRPPRNPDGVIKSISVTGESVFHNHRFPEAELTDILLNRYYYPYHRRLDLLSNQPRVKIALDCHSMLPYSPGFSKTPGKKRPAICLSNAGDKNGNQANADDPTTCPADIIEQLAECFTEAFELPKNEVLINCPFTGGHIIRSHYRGTIPWVQVEINKRLYLMDLNKKESIRYNPSKVEQVREKILTALKLFFLNNYNWRS